MNENNFYSKTDEVNATMEDLATWFLLKENMSNKKLQKLCYYAEAWSLVLLNQDIAKNAKFEAWIHGPVNKELWIKFTDFGWQNIYLNDKDNSRKRVMSVFTESQLDLLESVWATYEDFSANELENLSHEELPWKEQRVGLGKFEHCNKEISKKTMKEYYASLL